MPKLGKTRDASAEVSRLISKSRSLCRGHGAYVEVSELMPKPGKSMGGVEAAAEGSNSMTTGGAWRPREESSNMGNLAGVWHMSSGRGVRYPPRAAHGHFGRSLQTKKNRGDALAEDALAKVCVEL